jgi:AraC-like DNA-binding protein
VKTNHLLTGTNPPQWLSPAQIAGLARRSEYLSQRLAGELRLTPRTFERRFRRAFDCEPRKWLAQQRMRDALELLDRGLTPKQAAAELAFEHPQSLFRIFRRSFGCTPVEYQRQRVITPAPEVARFAPSGLSHSVTLLSHSVTAPGLRLTATT